jgi:hypothetical protein
MTAGLAPACVDIWAGWPLLSRPLAWLNTDTKYQALVPKP